MKKKEWRKILISVLALTMAVPVPVMAEETGGGCGGAGGRTADRADGCRELRTAEAGTAGRFRSENGLCPAGRLAVCAG